MAKLSFFTQRFTGWLVRIGPEAEQYGDKYQWCLPFSFRGKFEGVSTKPLSAAAVRTAVTVAKSLGYGLNGENLWERITPSMNGHGHKHATHTHVDSNTFAVTDQAAAIMDVAEYLKAMKDGKVTILAIAPPLPVPGLPGVVVKTFLMKE